MSVTEDIEVTDFKYCLLDFYDLKFDMIVVIALPKKQYANNLRHLDLVWQS